jgi:DNA-binding NarL/FixJ family response regulator
MAVLMIQRIAAAHLIIDRAGRRASAARTTMAVGLALPRAGSVAPVTPLRVVVAEDQVLLREGLSRLLADAGFEVVAQAGDAVDLRRKVAAHHPDVAVIDVQMPPDRTDDGLRAAIEIRREHPETGILMLSQFRDEAYALDLIGENAGGVGYLLKDRIADIDSFADAVRRVAGGGSALDPEIVGLMVGRRRKHDPLEALTPREHQVLVLMAEGKSNLGIAESLSVSLAAVEKHVGRIFGKLGLGSEPLEHRRVLAVLTLLRAS